MKTQNLITSAILSLFVVLFMFIQTEIYAQTIESTNPPLEITNKSGLKIVVQINSSATMPNGISKQVMAVKNLYEQYTNLGMKEGKDYEILMVFRADGAQFLLKDGSYDQKVKQPHPKGNPSKNMIEILQKNGVKMYECSIAMKMKGYKIEDIFPFSRRVVSGIGAVVDFEKSGYLLITP